MALFITYASYSQSGVEGLLSQPADRTGPISALLEKVGGKMVGLYMTTGTHDVVVISDCPDGTDAVAVGMAVASSGSVSKVETVRAWTGSEFVEVAQKAAGLTGSYTPPGS